MKLIVKFNLVFVLVFLLGLFAAGTVSDQLLQKNAREEIVLNARLVMESALARAPTPRPRWGRSSRLR